MTFRREWLSQYQTVPQGGTVVLVDNEECSVVGIDSVTIVKYLNGSWMKSRIENLLPRSRKNPFSVGACAEKGYEVVFNRNTVNLVRGKEVVATGAKQSNRVYRMLFKVELPAIALFTLYRDLL